MNKQFSLFDLLDPGPFSGDLPAVVKWLQENKMAADGGVYDAQCKDEIASNQQKIKASSTERGAQKLTQVQLKKLVEEHKGKSDSINGIDEEMLYGAMKAPSELLRDLDLNSLPVGAMAFYRKFHYPPFEQWGIYLLIDELIAYHAAFSGIIAKLKYYSPSTLMHYILFEVFNHEFFHHIVESTATTMEILFASVGDPKPIYLEYSKGRAQEEHEHAPLEEALANAYAYNSFSFINRVGVGCKTAGVKVFQAAMTKYWKREPQGYREAHNYILGGHIEGAAQLLGLILGKPKAYQDTPLMRVPKSVMPNGFSAYVSKPYIPTYLVGSPENIDLFYKLVPAPNEAYSRLFWPYDTSKIDKYIIEKKAKEKKDKQDISK